MCNLYHCPHCGRSKMDGLTIICPCRSPLEDEHILRLLNFMVADIKLRPEKESEITDKTCVAITAYIHGRESGRK